MPHPNLTHLIKTFQLEEGKTIKLNKQGFIDAMCQLDLETISEILQDNKPYSETTKTIFLEKLDALFLQIKTAGDPHLMPYQGKCCADVKICRNTNKKGVRFVGNHSGRHISFIIEEEKDKTIQDICVCNKFAASNYQSDSYKEPFDFMVFKDEEVNFKPSLKYLKTNLEAVTALDELADLTARKKVDKVGLINWVKTYKKLFYSFKSEPFFYKHLSPFFLCYRDVSHIAPYLMLEKQAYKALQAYININLNQEAELLKWLVTYEDLHYQSLLIEQTVLFENAVTDEMELDKNFESYCKIEDIQNCIDFVIIFESYYYDKLNKYTTQTQKVKKIPWDDEDDGYEILSLKYHLEKRGML